MEWYESAWNTAKDIGSSIGEIASNKNTGATLGGLGALGTALAAYQSGKATEQYNNDALALQKKSLLMQEDELKKKQAKENLAQTELDNAISSVWGTSSTETL